MIVYLNPDISLAAISVMVMLVHCPVAIQGQMDYYNNMYDAQSNYGTRGQNWFGSYQLGSANPYKYFDTIFLK